MNPPSTREEKIALIADKIKGIKTCHFVTKSKEGYLYGRPMTTQDIEFDGSMWFMTSKKSRKVSDIQADPSVTLQYSEGMKWVSLSGKAELVEDQSFIEENWTVFHKLWFESPQDPDIQLIKVIISHVEIQDHKGGRIGATFEIAQQLITGEKHGSDEEGDDNYRFDL